MTCQTKQDFTVRARRSGRPFLPRYSGVDSAAVRNGVSRFLSALGWVGATLSVATGQEAPPVPAGPTVGEEMARSYTLDDYKPQRVPVLMDDPESAIWEVNPHYAFALAQRLQRPLLLLFTARWNPKSLKLSEEVFATKSFNDLAKHHVVICYLDYPQNLTDAHPALRRWKEQFRVNGYPNLLVFDPEGNVVQDLTGYTTGKPVTYFNRLKGVVMPLVAMIDEKKSALEKKGFRVWRNQEGQELFARFVRHGGGLVTLQGANLETWTVSVATLADSDRALVASFPEVEELAAP